MASTVVLTATPQSGTVFQGWSGGGCSGTVNRVPTLAAATTVNATFTMESPPTTTLTVSKLGTGAGTVTSAPAGISCGTDCSQSYVTPVTVTLSAAADSGSTFAGWSGGGCSGTATCVVNMTVDQSVTATFTLNAPPPPATLTVNRTGTGTGTVTSTPSGISCGSDCTESYANGTVVTLSAAAASGSQFVGWGGACSGTGACVVTMSTARAVSAVFSANSQPTNATLAVLVAGSGPGTVTSTPAGIACPDACLQEFPIRHGRDASGGARHRRHVRGLEWRRLRRHGCVHHDAEHVRDRHGDVHGQRTSGEDAAVYLAEGATSSFWTPGSRC